VTEWRHEVRRVLSILRQQIYLLHPFTEFCWNIILGSLWANSTAIKYESFQTIIVWFFFKFNKSRLSRLNTELDWRCKLSKPIVAYKHEIWSVDSKENLCNCCHQMSSFNAKMHQIRFPPKRLNSLPPMPRSVDKSLAGELKPRRSNTFERKENVFSVTNLRLCESVKTWSRERNARTYIFLSFVGHAWVHPCSCQSI